jgi:5-methylcytosine-specific restriction protein B
MTTLSDERIRELYKAFDRSLTPGWHTSVENTRAHFEWSQALSKAQLAEPEVQNRLWRAIEIGSTGPSETIRVEGIIGDAVFTDQLIRMLFGTFSPEASQRAKELQALYDKLVERFGTVVGGGTPRARLRRIFLSLRPADAHCGYSDDAGRNIHALLVGRRGISQIEAGVLARARLREALGPDTSALENARRSCFCWWLHEKRAAIESGTFPQVQDRFADPADEGADAEPLAVELSPSPAQPPTVDPSAEPPPSGVEAPTPAVSAPLELWPLSEQIRWPKPQRDGVNTLRMILRECADRCSFVDLQAAVSDDLGPETAAPGNLRSTLRLLRKLDLLKEEGGVYETTDAGQSLLEAGSPDTLIEAFLVRVVGFAPLIRALSGGRGERAVLDAAPAAIYEHRDGRETLSVWLVRWGRMLGVIQTGRGRPPALTPLGEQWAARLPAVLPQPSAAVEPNDGDADIDDTEEGGAAMAPAPTFIELIAALESDPQSRAFVFPRSLVRGLYAAWSFHARKRFVLFSGLSGTGKTQLLLHYARLTCRLMGLDPREHLALVPVRPDWRDPTGLLGYHNALHADPTFQIEPALALVLRAARNPALPYFLILDEMNLARVERYFAPFLSAMESGEALQLHAEGREINGVPPTVSWPANLHIGGTVNMDETTYPFSDKVLDRAFTFEFWQVDLEGYFERRATEGGVRDGETEAVLLAFQKQLVPIRRHIGYRTAGEVLGWVAAAGAADPEASLSDLIDEAVFSKVLPRLRGSESAALRGALSHLETDCKVYGLRRCVAKLKAMSDRLQETGVTSFWS